MLPEGWYDIRIDSNKLEDSKSSGTPQSVLKGQVIASDSGHNIGKNVTIWLTHHAKMTGVFREFLDAAGIPWDRSEGPNGAGLNFNTDHFDGRIVRGQVTHEVWTKAKGGDDKARERWGNWQPSQYSQQAQVQGTAPQGPQAYQAPPAQQNLPQQGAQVAGQGQPAPRVIPRG
jgi:hypothetical protein